MKAIIVLLISSLVLTGCWDIRSIQDMNIVTALGIDYEKDHYIIYAKLTDFSAVGTQEGDKSKPASTWVGKGEGPTVTLAINDMYRSAQHHTLWTHVKSIVLTESALGKLEDIFDSLLRSREMRYISWVYGTKIPIEDIFTADQSLNQSPLMLEMFEPREVYQQRSAIEPVQLQQLINSVREPAASVLLPDLSITERKWTTNHEKNPSMMELDGVFVINKGVNQGWIAENQLSGTRLIRYAHMNRYPLNLNLQANPTATLNLGKPDASIRLMPPGNRLKFDIRITVHANVLEGTWGKVPSAAQMEERAQFIIEKQINEDFLQAQKKNIDAFGLEEWLYRHHFKVWKQQSSGGPLLPRMSIDHVKVKVIIDHSNTYTM